MKNKNEEVCELEARNISYRDVVKNVHFSAKPYELLAVAGPSGAGKSTLLSIISGKRSTNSYTGNILLNQRPVLNSSDFRRVSGYVTQRDILFPLLTVRETLICSARLRLGPPHANAKSRVDDLILELGLGHVTDSRVGDVSGGERRRVSIGVEAVHDPRILILDEPTSGLDSSSALQVVAMVKTMAEARGRTVVLSIHQPGYRIMKMFNSVLLMAEGRVVHFGTVERLRTRLGIVGLEVPTQTNVLEFAMDSIEMMVQRKGKTDRCTLQQLFQQHKVVEEETARIDEFDDLTYTYPNNPFTEISILSQRFLKTVYRTHELFLCRAIQMLISSFVLGSIFFNLNSSKVLERVGLFAFILTFLLSSTTEALPIFLQERDILLNELSNGSYRLSSYVIANSLVFLPFLLILAIIFTTPLYFLVHLNPSLIAYVYFLILIWLVLLIANSVTACFSALVPSFIVGNSLVAGVMGCFFLFSGYFIREKDMPKCWVFMHYVSLFKYPFEGMIVNEFRGKCVEYSGEVCLVEGDALLRGEGMGEKEVWRQMVVMLGFILGFRVASYVVLRVRCGLGKNWSGSQH